MRVLIVATFVLGALVTADANAQQQMLSFTVHRQVTSPTPPLAEDFILDGYCDQSWSNVGPVVPQHQATSVIGSPWQPSGYIHHYVGTLMVDDTYLGVQATYTFHVGELGDWDNDQNTPKTYKDTGIVSRNLNPPANRGYIFYR